MRISYVEIENFLCFRHLGMPLDRSLQMLAGPNNAGKSSFVRLLETFFSDPSSEELVKLLPRHAYYSAAGPRILSTITVWFSELSEDEAEEAGSAFRRDRKIWISLRCGRTGRVSYTASKGVSQEEAIRLYRSVLDRYQFVKIPSVRVGGANDMDQLASLERLLDTMEGVLIRRTAGPPTGVQKKFTEKIREVEGVVKEVLDQSAENIGKDLPFQGGDVVFSLDEPQFALRGMLAAATIESTEGTQVPVAERGTGFQSALVLGMLKYVAAQEESDSSNVLFAIEEPEAFLHPQTQRAMTQVLKRIAGNAQVVVTTHSPVVVDTFRLTQIARLPLKPEGMDFEWNPPALDDVQEGRLTRYCTAANSELIFANAAVLVEGEGDYLVVEHLFDRICSGVGGHYARGVTVIDAGGIGRIKRLVELAEHFNVRAHVLVDRDGLRADRKLLDVLDGRQTGPTAAQKQELRDTADIPSPTYTAARKNQAEINKLLEPLDAFVMVSDLEGMLIDAFGSQRLIELLGPAGQAAIDQQFIDQELNGESEDEISLKLRRKIGSKGWDGGGKATGKLEPHLPRIVVEKGLEGLEQTPPEVKRLEAWLRNIVDDVSTSAV